MQIFRLALTFPLLAGLAAGCSQPNKAGADGATAPTTAAAADTAALAKKPGWWKETVVYQIYPRSFQDSNGDGEGDLRGIISRLDYLQRLGVGTVWLNPIYASPNDDSGYDISDYRRIQPAFGTMQDFDALLQGLHRRGIKLVMDLVVNHSSDEHEWFRQARSSRSSPYRDYYHWWPAERGKPTPRWSFFDVNSDAWRYDSLTNSYYLHYFSRKQPDLNWENPKLRQEIYRMMRFWLDKGIDGFRMDAFQFVAKDPRFPVLPPGYEKNIIRYYGNGPHLHDYIQEMNREVLSKYNVMTVAEGAGSGPTDAMLFVDPARKELNMAYHFEGMDLANGPDGYRLTDFKRIYTRWDSAFARTGWLSIYLANHDQPRMLSKFGDDRPAFRAASAKLLNTFILTMRGTPYCYNGDELGMSNIRFKRIEDYRDMETRNGYQRVKNRGGDLNAFLAQAKRTARDNGRTPFQWDASAQAGFSTGTPWLHVNPNYRAVNAAAQEADSASVLNHFRRATALRRAHPVLVHGQYRLLDAANPHIYAYTRTLGAARALVVLNFTAEPRTWALPAGLTPGGAPWLNNYPTFGPAATLALQPWQALVLPLR